MVAHVRVQGGVRERMRAQGYSHSSRICTTYITFAGVVPK